MAGAPEDGQRPPGHGDGVYLINHILALLMCIVLVPAVALAGDEMAFRGQGDYPLDTFCWKDASNGRECVKIKWPSPECVFVLSMLFRAIDDYDMDRDGRITINDFGLAVSQMQKDAEPACGR
jgi:hypothetical protein